MQDQNDSSLENNKEELFNDNLKPLRTYQGDVEKAMGENNVSVATVAIAEQKRRVRENVNIAEDSNTKNKFFIYFGIFLFFAGLVAVGSIYYIKSKNEPLNQISGSSIINYTKKVDVSFNGLNRETIIEKIGSETKQFNQNINSLLYLNIIENGEKTKIQNVLALIAPSAPQALVRSLDSDYMIGVYWYNKNEPFLILTTKDYGASFAGMLKWEPDMYSDLGRLFDIQNISSTTQITFTDESAQNKDMRVLKDINNKNVLVYSFIDKNTIVIAPNEEVLSAIFGKFINSKMVR